MITDVGLDHLIERATDAHSNIEDDETADLVLKMLVALRQLRDERKAAAR